MKNKIEHRHGGDPEADFHRFGLPEKPVKDFSVNLNPLGPPGIILDQWMDLFGAVEGYPSVEGVGVAGYYKKRFGIPGENVLAANGSTEMIYLIPRVLRFKKVAIVTPSFHDYERASLAAGAEVSTVPLSMANDFELPALTKIAEILRHNDAVWIGRPNNPTGGLFLKEHILELAEMFPEKWFIVDEAFIQFVEDWEEKTLLKGNCLPNILVLHSLTKFYALAGLRIGALIGDKELIARLRKNKEPWTVNGIADRVAPLLSDCEGYEQQTMSLVSRERVRIYRQLYKLTRVRPFPSTVNFFLCQWKGSEDLDDLIRHLLENGIYIRDCRNFTGLERGFFRFGIRSVEDNDRLLGLLAGI